MFKTSKRGFTLIELLVVIAIIGILSSVVLVSLGSARTKANAAKARADLSQVMTAVEMGLADGCTPIIGTNVACDTTVYLTTVPAAPTSFTYTLPSAAISSTYTLTATGFTDGTFTCTNGSCSCSTANGCTK